MYIGHKKAKNKYQLYLCHSKRINGKSRKLINQYLCSIEKEYLEPREQYDEIDTIKDVYNELRNTLLNNASKVPKDKRGELKGKFNRYEILLLFLVKIQKLMKIESKIKV